MDASLEVALRSHPQIKIDPTDEEEKKEEEDMKQSVESEEEKKFDIFEEAKDVEDSLRQSDKWLSTAKEAKIPLLNLDKLEEEINSMTGGDAPV